MNYSAKEIMQYIEEEDVKFIRLAFCDIFGKQKNISVMPGEIERAFTHGIAVDASAIDGFGGEIHSDLFLRPDMSTLVRLPWRPEHGSVVRMFCDVKRPDGSIFENDTRSILKKAVADAKAEGVNFAFGSELEFYLFMMSENGSPTKTPYDNAGYMDIAPDDKGENVRREICLTLEQMDIRPESSHHEEGPGQNEIDFKYSDPLTAADNAVTFRDVVKAISARNGLSADFTPKPLADKPGSGFHINISVSGNGEDLLPCMIAGILKHIKEITLFLNPSAESYGRLGQDKAPGYITWSAENRSQLIRVPFAKDEYRRAELRSADPTANPYLAFALLIYAALDGIRNKLAPPESADFNLFTADAETLKKYDRLPRNLEEAKTAAGKSEFVRTYLPKSLIDGYCSI